MLATLILAAASYQGSWKIERVERAPWAAGAPDRGLEGSSVTFAEGAVLAPPPLGCRHAGFTRSRSASGLLFQGSLGAGAPATARRLAIPDPAETLSVSCDTGVFDYHAAGGRLVTALDNDLLWLSRAAAPALRHAGQVSVRTSGADRPGSRGDAHSTKALRQVGVGIGCADHIVVSLSQPSFDVNGAGRTFTPVELTAFRERIGARFKMAAGRECVGRPVAARLKRVVRLRVESASGATEAVFFTSDPGTLVLQWTFAEDGLATPSPDELGIALRHWRS